MRIPIGRPVVDLVKRAYDANLPVMLQGAHGIGKSEIMKAIASEIGVACRVMDLSLCEPMDLVGLPQIKDGVTHFAPPSLLPRDGRGLLVIEELNRAPSYVRRPCLQLLTERALNDYRLPDGWLPVACVNPPPSDTEENASYDVEELDPALLSRFMRVEVTADLGEWLRWAKGKVHPAVVSFVQGAGVTALTSESAQPRSWSYVSRWLDATEAAADKNRTTLQAAITGFVGQRWAVAFLRSYEGTDLPLTAEEILAADETIQARVRRWTRHKRIDLLEASTESLRRHLRTTEVARRAVHEDPTRQALRDFVLALPPDPRRAAKKWLESLTDTFNAESIFAS